MITMQGGKHLEGAAPKIILNSYISEKKGMLGDERGCAPGSCRGKRGTVPRSHRNKRSEEV